MTRSDAPGRAVVASFREALCAKMLGEASPLVARQLCHAVASEASAGAGRRSCGWPATRSGKTPRAVEAGDASRAPAARICLSLARALVEADAAGGDAGAEALSRCSRYCAAGDGRDARRVRAPAPGRARSAKARKATAFGSASWVDARCGLAALNALARSAQGAQAPRRDAAPPGDHRAPASDPRCVVEACRLVGALSMATKEAYQRACSENEIPSPVPPPPLADAGAEPAAAGALCAALSVFASAGEDDGGDPAYVEQHLDAVLAAIAGDLGAAGPQQGGDDVDADLPLSVLLPAAVSVVKTCGGAAVDAYLEAIAAPLLAAATAVPQISHAPNVGGDDAGRKEEDGTYSVVMGDLRITVDLRALWAKEKASDLLGELADACGDCLPPAAATLAEALAPLATLAGSESVRSTASLSLGQVVGAAVARLRKHPGEPGLLESAGAPGDALRTVSTRPGDRGRRAAHAHLDSLAQTLLTLATASTQRRDAIEKDLANDDAYDAEGEDADAPGGRRAAPLVLAMSLKILSQGLGGADLRATAAYAVAVVSRSPLGEELVRSTTQNNPQAAADLLRSVADAAPRPEDDDDDDPDAAARVAENAANAVKAIVDAVYGGAAPERAPLLGWWLAKLPLTADDEEARRAHKDLASLVESRDAALFGDAANVSTAAARGRARGLRGARRHASSPGGPARRVHGALAAREPQR
ncbi:hypothetical protein JL721_6194 [Aureococcus anophagefferens]|nr:hypothetical protein JL721_6194 [Aureococcus anophagefferens]